MKDKFGVEVEVGDTIVYATRRSSSIGLHKARVLVIENVPSPWGGDRYRTRLKIEVDPESKLKLVSRDPYKFVTVMVGRKATLTSPTFIVIQKGTTPTESTSS